MKIVVNKCYGGFGLSKEAYDFLNIPCKKCYEGYYSIGQTEVEADRSHPDLVRCVETLGNLASGKYANLEIVEIPDDVEDWYIDEYDGMETVREGRSW